MGTEAIEASRRMLARPVGRGATLQRILAAVRSAPPFKGWKFRGKSPD
jgi:hypothetical protein